MRSLWFGVLVCAAMFVACGDDDSSFATRPSDGSSSSVCEDCDDESSSSVKSSSSSARSSSSAKSSSSSAESSSSVTLATPCKTDSTDTCEYGELVDDRDGQTYKTVKIGDQWWMAENLNYETHASYCYNDSAEYCEKYGRLYTWVVAMDSTGTWTTNGKGCGYYEVCSPTYPVRGVCPRGWHLPNKTEWEILFNAAGGKDIAGKNLKSTSGWNVYRGKTCNGTDAFGFSALLAAYRYRIGDYYREDYDALFWSSTESDSYGAYNVALNYGADDALLNDNNRGHIFSVRCIQD